MLASETLPLNVCMILSYPFSDGSFFTSLASVVAAIRQIRIAWHKVLLWPCRVHIFINMMAGWEVVESICRHSDSGIGDEDGPKFIQCVDGRKPQIHEVWTFSEDGVTCEIHPTEWVDVGAGFVSEFVTNYLTPSWRRISTFGENSINGTIQFLTWLYWLIVEDFHWTMVNCYNHCNQLEFPTSSYSIFLLWLPCTLVNMLRQFYSKDSHHNRIC